MDGDICRIFLYYNKEKVRRGLSGKHCVKFADARENVAGQFFRCLHGAFPDPPDQHIPETACRKEKGIAAECGNIRERIGEIFLNSFSDRAVKKSIHLFLKKRKHSVLVQELQKIQMILPELIIGENPAVTGQIAFLHEQIRHFTENIRTVEDKKVEQEEQTMQVKTSYLFTLAEKRPVTLYVALLSAVLSGLAAFVPYIMVYRTILFLFGEHGNMQLAFRYGVIAVVAILLRHFLQVAAMALTHMGAYELLYLVRKKLCGHIGEIELGFFNHNSVGEIKKVLMEDVERLEKFYAHQIPDITVAIAVPSLILIELFRQNWMMACMLLIPIVFTFAIQALEFKLARPAMQEYPKILGKWNSAVMQYIRGMQVMRAYQLSADSYENYKEAVTDYNVLWKRVAKQISPLSAVSKVVIESGILFTLPLGGWLYIKGQLELGSYLFFLIMSIVFLASFQNLLNFAQIFSQISSGLAQIKKVMDIPAMQEGKEEPETGREHEIVFEHVSFGYEKKEVLHDVNLTVKGGGLTAFVGPSGAGKTTAAQLIPRFFDVTDGRILIDGQDIREMPMEKLMDLVAFVFQDAFLLNDTIRNNIAIGKKDAGLEEVKKAAAAAQIDAFIESLPDGYETRLGEAGIKLSGGEKQRICIARAILKDAPILIFDEATSYTDGENEYKIQQALNELIRGKTTVMIAHRLHTIVEADQICVFQDGKITERGKHEELLKVNGVYAGMWRTYTGEEGQA